jgi:OPA family sugar phosphate sensor protein UhpC-like MFS transporter
MPAITEHLGFDKSELGFIATILSLAYGLSKFVSGVLGDRSNPRYFMAIGLFLTGVINICFGFSSSLFWFAIFWGLNGWFQGFGWPPCARYLTHWYSHSERGAWWSVWNASHNIGGFLTPLLAAASISYFGGWQYAMFIPGVLCIVGSLFLINRLRDTPQSLGLPPIEKYRNDYVGGKSNQDDERELTSKEILFEYVLKNKFIWILAFSYFFVYIVRTGVNDWSAFFLIEQKGYGTLGANSCVSLFEVGGFLGSLLAGWSSDRLFMGRRGPVNALFAGGMLLAIGAFWLIPKGYPFLDSCAMFVIGALVFGPQMLIGVAAAELSHKKAAATATGFAGWFAYVGAASAGYPLGKITQELGWEGFFVALAVCSLAATLLLLPLWSVESSKAQTLQSKTA